MVSLPWLPGTEQMVNAFKIGKLKLAGLEEVAAWINSFTTCQVQPIFSFAFIQFKVKNHQHQQKTALKGLIYQKRHLYYPDIVCSG